MRATETLEEEFDLPEEFAQKLSALDEALQRFSDEEMRQVASLLDQQVQYFNRSPIAEMESDFRGKKVLEHHYQILRGI